MEIKFKGWRGIGFGLLVFGRLFKRKMLL